MKRQVKKWQVIGELIKTKDSKDRLAEIVQSLLISRGVGNKKEQAVFFDPPKPDNLTLKILKIDEQEVKKLVTSLKKALVSGEQIIVYGDYDADGICGTAVLWETLFAVGLDVLPYIPERFSEGYGLNVESVKNLKDKYPKLKLIITVDNGITANQEIAEIKRLGVETIIIDHHLKAKKAPKALAVVHTEVVCAAALAWVVSQIVLKKIPLKKKMWGSLDLVAIATIADQVPLIGANRSFAKFGLEALNKSQRPGLLALINEASVLLGSLGVYEVGFLIAPRINATGRIEHGIDSLRLLCTKDKLRAEMLASTIGRTNRERQRIVDEVTFHAQNLVGEGFKQKVLVLSHESYHEGVIGLAASKLVERFHRPVIVISKGETLSKASARSIPGFNIIESIRKVDSLLIGGGGHPMAAGFSIQTTDIELFIKKFSEVSEPLLTDELLERKLKIDLELTMEDLKLDLLNELKKFEPFGLGNPAPVFVTRGVEILEAKLVGKDQKHLKFKIRDKNIILDAIAFGMGELYSELKANQKVDIVYSLEQDTWSGREKVQLKIKDVVRV